MELNEFSQTPRDTEAVRKELAAEPQVPDLPWPPPADWPWHDIGVQIRSELAKANRTLASFSGDAIQRTTLEAHRRRLAGRLARYKKIVFFSGWRPWQHREPTE